MAVSRRPTSSAERCDPLAEDDRTLALQTVHGLRPAGHREHEIECGAADAGAIAQDQVEIGRTELQPQRQNDGRTEGTQERWEWHSQGEA